MAGKKSHPNVGDVVRYTCDDELGLVLEVLNPQGFYVESLGCAADYVLKVLVPTGQVREWDFYDSQFSEDDPELEIVHRFDTYRC